MKLDYILSMRISRYFCKRMMELKVPRVTPYFTFYRATEKDDDVFNKCKNCKLYFDVIVLSSGKLI